MKFQFFCQAYLIVFTYKSDLKLKIGDFVEVSFGKTKKIGVVWNNFEKKIVKILKLKRLLEN